MGRVGVGDRWLRGGWRSGTTDGFACSAVTGQDCEGYVPVLYPGSHLAEDPQLRLGAATDWTEEGGLVRGLGRKVLYADGEELEILALRTLETGG